MSGAAAGPKDGQGVQHQLAMAEAHSLGIPGRSGRVERGRYRIFIKVFEHEVLAGNLEQLLVFARGLSRRPIASNAILDPNETPQRGQLSTNPVGHRQEITVHEEDLGAGMPERVCNLIGRQPDVYGLQNRSHHRNRKKALEGSGGCPSR